MNKKLKLIVLSLFVILCCTGCGNSSITRDLRHAGFNLSEDDFSCDALIPKQNQEYEAIKYVSSTFAITTTGVIHELSFGKKFSNEEYCKKADTNLTVEALVGSEVFRAEDNKIYYLKKSDSHAAYTEVPISDSNYPAYRFFLKDNHDLLKVQSVGDSTYYVLKEDGDVYRYVLGRNNSNGVYLVSSSKMYTHDNYGSEILDFNYAGEKSEATFIRTEDSIYRNTALNRDMCLKYVDIDCEYEFLKDEILTEHYEHIMAYNGSMLITNYLKVFNLNTGN